MWTYLACMLDIFQRSAMHITFGVQIGQTHPFCTTHFTKTWEEYLYTLITVGPLKMSVGIKMCQNQFYVDQMFRKFL